MANGWKQVAVTETAAQVSKLGRELYERLATMGPTSTSSAAR
ncbi:DNA recombination protein RmuC [Tessaracoccus sp. HDW20]|nr:hypothetical protein [Tessaracoccus coleopterorum]NHB84284.1 DNA recombination protein RmuC [Tessaracoccus coleopterorum]